MADPRDQEAFAPMSGAPFLRRLKSVLIPQWRASRRKIEQALLGAANRIDVIYDTGRLLALGSGR